MTRKRFDFELLLVGLTSFGVNAVVAYIIVFRLNLFLTDAMARTRSAWQVFFSGEPKLTNIGFVWAPLPTLLQLPFVLIPQLRYKGLSSNAVTVLMGAGTAMLLMVFLRRAKVSGIARWLILATFVLNPMILFYSGNGMSEMTLLFFVLLTLYLYLRWHETMHWLYLAGAGVAAGMAFLARYDAAFTAAALAIVIGLEGLLRRPDDPRFSESIIFMYAAPVAYLVGLWVVANWVIMGDPLFFARSAYSNAGQIGYQYWIYPQLLPLKGDFEAALRASIEEAWRLFPPFIILSFILPVLIMARRGGVWLSIIIASWSLILFSAFNVYAGQSAMFLRYFIAAIPMAFVFAGGMLELLPRWQTATALALAVLFGVSGYASLDAMRRADDWGQWNDVFVNSLLSGKPAETWQPEQELADYITTQTKGLVLVDDFQGYRIVFFSGQPARFITPADSTFGRYLHDPVGRANYILVSAPELEGTLNQINLTYPYLYKDGAGWVKLEKEAWVWKLYRIVGEPGQAAGVGSTGQTMQP